MGINSHIDTKKVHQQTNDIMVTAMKRIRLKLLGIPFILSCTGLLIASPAVAEDLDVNRLLASQCAQCHGTDGYARGDMDGLAGDEDLAEDLLDMKGEDKAEDIMDHQALGYTNDQIRRIASYYAGLPENQRDGADDGERSTSSGDTSGSADERNRKEDRARDEEDERDEDEDQDEREDD